MTEAATFVPACREFGVDVDGIGVETTGTVDAAVDRVEHPVVEGGKGKVAPFERGIGRTGLAAVPTGWPCPGNLRTAAGAESAATTLAA